MAKKLVIVESPTKAKTIRQFLGRDYTVEASVGHIRDLPDNRKGLPEEHRKKWWADYAVDVDNGFEPFYEVPSEKKKHVDRLKEAMKGVEELVLATDEDREGESIGWHLLQVLKPGKKIEVKRIAFHELTKRAVLDAIENPRPLDLQLVDAQETRRILDRLYGYTLSPVLWTKISRELSLSAGRVQSPAVKLIVDRERRRRDFVVSVYWDLKVDLEAHKTVFPAVLKSIDGARIATGADFDELTGELKNAKALLVDEQRAGALAEVCRKAKPWKVERVEKSPAKEKQPPPFRTTTLQQEANRKFGFSPDRTMRIAQDLYEGIEINGTQVGLITYMRTDSLNLAEEAIRQARETIADKYGREHVPDKPNRYTSKVANAQEAHEAIRPSDFSIAPESIRGALTAKSDGHYKLYELIYRRTLACQMKPAEVLKTSADIGVDAAAEHLTFLATGKEITYPGYLLAYVEDLDDADAAMEAKERVLPELKVGQEVLLNKLDPARHETRAPARYTEATLIKALEDLGIGRPSTYASICSVIEDRGYVRKVKRELIPTWVAFLAMEILENFFQEFIDLKFTAHMDESLDEIANGREEREAYLRRFFLGGTGSIGLHSAVEERKTLIPFPNVRVGAHPETGELIVVRLTKDGRPFLQVGDGETKRYGNIPDELSPADLNVDKSVELLSAKASEAESLGVHPESGRRLLLKRRQGYYLEVERTAEEIEAKVKPTWVSLPEGVDPRSLTQEDLDYLCALPKMIGLHPDTKEPIVFRLGKYGPYVQCGADIRNVATWRDGATMDVPQAITILAQPKTMRRQAAASGPIQDFGPLEGSSGPVRVMPGRFGPYVTDGTINATLPKSADPYQITPEQALELIQAKAAAGPSAKKPVRGRRAAAKPGAQPAAKKPGAKKTAAKKPAPKKKTA